MVIPPSFDGVIVANNKCERCHFMKKENKIAVCRQHWTAFTIPGLFCFIFAIAAVGSIFDSETIPQGIATFITGIFVSGLFALYIFISYKFNYIALTETSIIGHIGFIKSRKLSTPLQKVQSLGLSNGLLGKIFGYHTITVSHAGTDVIDFVFKHMANAEKFSEKVNELI